MKTSIIEEFNSEQFGTIRTMNIGNEPWFVGKDVAEVLGYSNASKAVSVHVDTEDKQFIMLDIADSHNGNVTIGQSKTAVINESGLYSLVLSSKLPSAKEFKRWITSEVLPTIRKTGGYVANEDTFINTYLPYADDNTKNLFRVTLHTINQLNDKITKDKPLVEFAEHIQASKDVIDMKSMAKLASKNGVKIGRNKLFTFLRDRKILDKENIPYANYMNRDWFEVVENTYTCLNGEVKINKTTLVSPKGQVGIIKQLKTHYA